MPEGVSEVPQVEPDAGLMFVFKVKSRSRPMQHTVDLEAYHWNGSCDCEHFRFNCEPLLAQGAHPKDNLRCSHIRDARSFMLDCIIPKLAVELKRTQNKR